MRWSGTAVVVLMVVGLAACTSGSVDTTSASAPSPSPSVVSTTAGFGGSTTKATEVPPVTVPLSDLQVTFVEFDSGFDHPVLLVSDPDGGSDFVVEQPGRIVRADGATHSVALDIRDSVRFNGEQGLLGLAFHPDFAQNRLAYVNYVDNRGRTVIGEFTVNSGVFDADSGLEILGVDQPARNHNGGMIAFGPRGYLWIGMGDGGASNDRFGNGQNSHTLLGSMLRIAVPGAGPSRYDIPESNPYADGSGGAPEVYWTGLRNPWRFAFDFFNDGMGADVWIADVGQNEIEEISVMFTGNRRSNFGWPVMEGSECFGSDDCDREPFTPPVTEYRHDEGCSITGGYVYRGDAIPELAGHFFYSDFCTGFIRSVSPATGDHDWTPLTGKFPSPSGFGIGGDGELYLVSHNGMIYRLERVE